MKRFIFFRNDRLGDFLILTSIIKGIKNKYKDSHITVVCSEKNYKLIKSYDIINKIFVYNKSDSIYKKISIFKKIISFKYYASFAIDGKTFSNLCNFFLRAKIKLGLVYRYKLLGVWFTKPNFLYNYFSFNKFETFTSKKDLQKIEHLPTKLINLGNYFKLNLNPNNKYYFKASSKNNLNFKKYYSKNIRGEYVLIHIDEKWNDLKLEKNEFFLNLISLKNRINKKIIITSFNNKFDYFKILKNNILKLNSKKDLLLIENSNLFFFERLIKYSFCSISCHSGFLVQVAGANSSKIIDIINKKDFNWYSCWKPKNTKHRFVFKSTKVKSPINKVFNHLSLILKSYL